MLYLQIMRKSTSILFTASIVAGIALQLTAGNFPVRFFAFPLGTALGVLWIALTIILYRERKDSIICRIMLSPQATVWSLSLFLAGCLVIGLFPQLTPSQAAAHDGIAGALGCYNFMSSWPFVITLILLLTNLGFVTVRRLFGGRNGRKWRFVLNHAGIWLALFAGFIGSTDESDVRMAVDKDSWNNRAYDSDANAIHLKESYRLSEFEVEKHPDGSPSGYSAKVIVASSKDTMSLDISVNNPQMVSFGKDVYISGYDTQSPIPQYCVLQIVTQPYRYMLLAGIIMTLAGAVAMFAFGPGRQEDKYDKRRIQA